MHSPPASNKNTARADHPWNRLKEIDLLNFEHVEHLLRMSDVFTISSERSGICVFVNRNTLDYMLHGLTAIDPEKGFVDDKTHHSIFMVKDPTATEAIRRLLHKGGPYRLAVDNKGWTRIPDHLMLSLVAGTVTKLGRAKKTKSGNFRQNVWLIPANSENKTPVAEKFADSSNEGFQQENLQEEFRV